MKRQSNSHYTIIIIYNTWFSIENRNILRNMSCWEFGWEDTVKIKWPCLICRTHISKTFNEYRMFLLQRVRMGKNEPCLLFITVSLISMNERILALSADCIRGIIHDAGYMHQYINLQHIFLLQTSWYCIIDQ